MIFYMRYILYRGAAQRQAASYISVKEVKHMRLTITLTLRKLMFQFIIKSRSRHSAK